jgi:hypothetical protein
VKSIYFVQVPIAGPIKIGFSSTLKARIRALDAAVPWGIKLCYDMPGDVEEEQRIHTMFEKARIRGEWFSASERLCDWIEGEKTRDMRTGQDWAPAMPDGGVYDYRVERRQMLRRMAEQSREIETLLMQHQEALWENRRLLRIMAANDERK